MQPSTTIGVALRSCGNPLLNDYEQTIQRLYNAGYRVLDFAFVCHNYSNYILRQDDWQQRLDRIKNLAEKLGITFTQSHLPYITETMYCADPNFKKPGYAAYFDECMRRSVIGSAMLGVRYGTVHPMTLQEIKRPTSLDHQKCKRVPEKTSLSALLTMPKPLCGSQ